MKKRPVWERIIKIVGIVCWLVIMSEIAFHAIIGGSATLGYIDNGRYFVRNHGTITEVSETLWTISYVWEIVVTAMFALICGGVIVGTVVAAISSRIKSKQRTNAYESKRCDLHVHSNRSDGTLTPTALAAAAKEAGLSAIALTDHNTVAGLPEFIKACEELYMEAVPGVEISTEYEGVELHILGLYIPENAFADVENYVAQYNIRKEKSNRALVGRLREAGYLIDYDEIVASTPDGHINRAHIAKALLDKGYVDSVKSAFSTLLGEGKGFYIPPERTSALDAVTFIKAVGAVPVWAHPFLQMDEDGARRFLSEAVPLGLSGMETRYSLYDTETEAAADRLIKEFNILPSGGSDFHGEVKPDIKLGIGKGNLHIPLTFARDLRRLAKDTKERNS